MISLRTVRAPSMIACVRLTASFIVTTAPLPPIEPPTVTMKDAVKRTQAIIDGARTVRKDIIFLSHGGPIAKPEDAAYINEHTDCVGFVGASSLERLAVEESLTNLTRTFKKIPVKQEALRFLGGGKKR